MKTLCLSLTLVLSASAFAGTVSVKLKDAGRYIVTLSAPNNCSPGDFTITPFETGSFGSQGRYMKANVEYILNSDVTTAVCRVGSDVATGLISVGAGTVLTIDLANAMQSPSVKVEKITGLRSVK